MGGFGIHDKPKSTVALDTDGFREMGLIREQALGDLFQRGGLQKRINWLQAKAVQTTWAWRWGLRW